MISVLRKEYFEMRKVQVSDHAVVLILTPGDAAALAVWLECANAAACATGCFKPLSKVLRAKIKQQMGG